MDDDLGVPLFQETTIFPLTLQRLDKLPRPRRHITAKHMFGLIWDYRLVNSNIFYPEVWHITVHDVIVIS